MVMPPSTKGWWAPLAASLATVSAGSPAICSTTAPPRRQVERPASQHHHALAAIRPGGKGQNRFEGIAADHQRIDAGHELVIAVGFAAARWQKIKSAVGARNESVDAGSDKNRHHGRRLLPANPKRRHYR